MSEDNHICNHLSRGVIQAQAPAKLIISGEHSVIYGKPALAMAINSFASTTIRATDSRDILFDLVNLNYTYALSVEELKLTKQQIEAKYEDFLAGKININEILTKPNELLQYAFAFFVAKLQSQLECGVSVKINSSIPVGCGMGSSAATIISLLHAFTNFFDGGVNKEQYMQLGCAVENLQHGRSSGLDIYLSIHGGSVCFEDGRINKLVLPNISFYLVNTGRSNTSTGECVMQAAKYFKHNQLADDFAAVTGEIQQALARDDLNDLQRYIRDNHRLLQYIKVVPEKVSNFINEIETYGGAAKISGAGAVWGESAGVVLITAAGDNKNFISDLVHKYGYEIISVQGELDGVRII